MSNLLRVDQPSAPTPARDSSAELLTQQSDKRAQAVRLLRVAISRSDLKYQAVSDIDHSQLCRQINGKEKLGFHEMFATWPPAVWQELISLLALEFGGDVARVITMPGRRGGAR